MSNRTYSTLQENYQKKTVFHAEEVERLRKKYNRFALVRLLAFFAGIGLAALISDFGFIATTVFLVAYIVAFGRFMIWHQNIAYQRRHHAALRTINENEIKYASSDFGDFADGKEFLNPLHPYAVDLDVFGKFSLFQYINRASTILGKKRLANYFLNIPTFEEIKKRQASAVELSERLEWRQNFQAYGIHTEDSVAEINLLKKWLYEPNFIFNNRGLRITMIVLPILTWALIILSFYWTPYQIAVVFAVIQLILLKVFVKKIGDTHQFTTNADKILNKYARIIEHIEKQSFETEKLKGLHLHFSNEQLSASRALKQLSYRIGQLNVRYNIFAFVLSVTVLWDFQWVLKLEQWKEKHKSLLPNWLDALEEFEAMNSLATLHYNHPDWIFPNIHPNSEIFEGESIGHPLIHREKRITNHLGLPNKGHIKLITGSNMAGKSTFLRTVGVNIIISMMGAPVCAKRFHLPLLEVYTSMRTQDALHESTSSFYAELKRLKVIIEAVESKPNVFFLLDEILKGTNSNDRHKGAKALILQLIKTQGMGLIATHDLDLGVLEADYPSVIENLCMEVEVKEQELVFDYTIKKGVSQSFNATFLMRNMGIKV
jgi:hypothetical protein